MKLVIWEIWSYLHIPLIWYLYRRFSGRDVSGSMIAGSIVGLFLEFSTEPLWTYHFRFTFYKDVAPSIVLGWGVLFTFVVTFSEWLHRTVLGVKRLQPGDRRIFLFDVVAACLIAFPMETIGLKSGVWEYNQDLLQWGWGVVPFFDMPFEALFGYCLLMVIAPSFIRRWRDVFSIASAPPAPQIRKKRVPRAAPPGLRRAA